MLSNAMPMATLPCADLDRAAKFYDEVLGLTRDEFADPEGVAYKLGAGSFFVYKSEYAGTNQATAMTIVSSDFDADVAGLREAGVQFETYDMPDVAWEDGVAIQNEMRGAWFRDPEGNILAIIEDPR